MFSNEDFYYECRRMEGITPTFDLPTTTTSGPSAGGSCENLPTVKRRIGAGEKSLVDR